MNRTSKLVLNLFLVLALASMTLWMSCEKSSKSPVEPTVQEPIQLSKAHPLIQATMVIQERHTPDLMANPEVVGTAVTLTEDGKPAIMVMTKTHALKKGQAIPEMIEGIPVVVEVTGEIVAMKPGGGGGVSHTAKQTPPIQLGTSGSWKFEIANGYCCSGTLGSLVHDNNKQYILSNSHVFVGDVVPGGNRIVAEIGDPVIQPGLIDVQCNASLAQEVAQLSSQSTIYPPSSTPNIDAAIAEVIPTMVRTDGAILEIGTLSATTVGAFIGQKVKKSGRTSGLTRSTISGLNASVSVGYSDECGGNSFTKLFTGQILIKNKGSKFLASGDSGSLMVEDKDSNPGAIGLLYAGSSVTAVANPIDDVLNHFGVSMVGN